MIYEREAEIIYFIYYNDICIYVGQTFGFLCRQQGHLVNYKMCVKNPTGPHAFLYKYLCENKIEWDDLFWKYTSFEKNIDRIALNKIEKLFIQTLKPICNVQKKRHTYAQAYYQVNKEKMKANAKKNRKNNDEKIICGCGAEIFKRTQSAHQKSKKHMRLVNKN